MVIEEEHAVNEAIAAAFRARQILEKSAGMRGALARGAVEGALNGLRQAREFLLRGQSEVTKGVGNGNEGGEQR